MSNYEDNDERRTYFDKPLANLQGGDNTFSIDESTSNLYSARAPALRLSSSLNVPTRLVGTQNENIRVFLRMRPFNQHEMGDQESACQQWVLLANRTAISL